MCPRWAPRSTPRRADEAPRRVAPHVRGKGPGPKPRWIVDGMNVIGSRPDRWWNDPDKAVGRLIDQLDRYGSRTGEAVTVVFDRHPADVAPGRNGGTFVSFATRRGRNAADHDIVQMVAKDGDPSALTVVTSDADLAERVTGLGARVRSSGSFRRHLDDSTG